MSLVEKLKHYRISEQEYSLICDQLGRPPEGIEWALYSALWSEHCSYKSSKVHLKKLFSKSDRVLQSFGENAGVIDLGEGEKVAFKMESHNHPSFIEPYQGAATGVGGILRDIFTMGARPVALGNYLCFGEPKADRMDFLVRGVVSGISGYGNCVGVPNITGQTEFDSSYNNNILVNAFAVGLFRPGEKVFTAKAAGPGNLVVYVGAKTGGDGVHGASMASESFDDDNESKKPNVQIGDPFFEKLLIESCIEVMNKDLVVAIQDMGAAGLTSSSFEMASSGGVGFDISLDKVPLREDGMTPEEILLSESQERMLLICEPAKLPEIEKVFSRWGLDACSIGTVTKEKVVRLSWKGEEICRIDPDLLVENAPQYKREYKEWSPKNRVSEGESLISLTKKPDSFLLDLLSDIRGCSRNWIFQQYDQRVGAQTARDCSSDVGIVRLPDSGRGLAVVLGCRPYVMRMDAQIGGIDSVGFPAVELSSKGYEPLAVTDCLNFGNPEKPEIMSEFVASLNGMSSVCEALKAPIISGNVSLYNETNQQNITSTPATGVVGLGESLNPPQCTFQNSGESIYLIRKRFVSMSGLSAEKLNQENQFFGKIEADQLASFCTQLQKFVQTEKPTTSKVVGKFGLAYTLARMTLKGVGARVETAGVSGWSSQNEKYFAEDFYQVIVSLDDKKTRDFSSYKEDFEIIPLGQTGTTDLVIDDQISLSIESLNESYDQMGEHIRLH